MRIGSSSLLVLAVVLLSPTNVNSERIRGTARHDEINRDKKISTSLKIEDTARNRTDKIGPAARTSENGERDVEVTSVTHSTSQLKKSVRTTVTSSRSSSGNASAEEGRPLYSSSSREKGTREIALPSSQDIAKMLSDDTSGENDSEEDEEEEEEEEEENAEQLPEAQELRHTRPGARRRPFYRPPPLRRPTTLNRRNVFTDTPRTSPIRPSKRPTEPKRGPTDKECTFFTRTVCLQAMDYPHEAIRRSLRSNKDMTAALLTDFKTQERADNDESLPIPLPLESKFETRYENRYESNEIKRRSDSPFDNVEEGFTCPSVVKYARPQLARAASGMWKYIINTGEHTQTIRLEKCSKAQSGCSFISENYRSSCVQVYNYHRLLAWDSKLGLHMDIFKVPTCCSCHVHGYSDIFPPHQKDPPSKPKESFPGANFATADDQKDDFEDIGRPNTNYINKYNPSSSFDSSLGTVTQNVRAFSDGTFGKIVPSLKKPTVVEPSRPSYGIPGRTRPKKPSPLPPRPYDKLPQQHAPNTRAPGYTGPLMKGSRPGRPHRPPFRRESSVHAEEYTENPNNSSVGNRYSQPYDQNSDASTRLQNGGFDDEYQEPPQRRINYNYHPIIDFFKPEASMLQSEAQFATQSAPVQSDSNSWKPMISS